MGDRIVFSIVVFIITFVPGLMGVFKPVLAYKTTATNTLKKTPSKSAIKRYKISSYISMIIGCVMIVLILLGYTDVG
ncbi:hypothetical protein [Cohnella boryungensis]|uniref:Uncharacterized protein n=1 Tax=Cohnella boryungensis TaxID=768479 RepID=A0ABV8SEJ3_9BACL